MSIQPKRYIPYLLYSLCWFFVNLLTLTAYPVMHSDEAWLAGLSQSMMEKGTLLTTEPFFDLAPRAPHTLKVLFHLFQMPLLMLFGYELFSVRLLSLIFGLLAVALLMGLMNSHHFSLWHSLLTLFLVTTSSQFIYAAHFGRQEIIITALQIGCLWLYQCLAKEPGKRSLTIGTLIGLSIMVHPNAFFIGVMMGIVYIWDWRLKKVRITEMLLYALPMGLSALINIAVTLLSTPNFLKNYWAYASELQVGAAPAARTQNFLAFYLKLYNRISGTYYLTDLRWVFWIGCIALTALVVLHITGFKCNALRNSALVRHSVAMIIGYNIALFIIGRYNQTSILFMTIPVLLLTTELLRTMLPDTYGICLTGVLLLLSLNLTYQDYSNSKYHDYDAYTVFLEENVLTADRVLGNLSGGFSLEPDQFHDIRNLAYLTTDIETYLKDNGIDTVIWYEEYDYIHRNEHWQILYGDDSHYYEDIKKILAEHGTLQAQTTSTHYGNRIIRYQDGYPWNIWIYTLTLGE